MTVAFVALAGLGLARHELWRDEAFTWLVLSNSPTPSALWANLDRQFVGHPRPYYVLAWLLGAAGSFWPVRIANLLAAAAAVGLFSLTAPFSRFARIAFAFGFFPLYQYGVFTRSYSLLLLALVGACAAFERAPGRQRTLWLTVALCTLPQLHLFGAMAALVLLAADLACLRRVRREHGLIALSLALAAWQLVPPTGHALLSPAPWSQLPYALANGFLPVFGFWPRQPLHTWLSLGLLAVAFAALCLQPHAWKLAAPLFIGLLAVFKLAYSGHRWHHGFFFLFFVVALWLARPPRQRRIHSALVCVLLAAQLVAGFAALYRDVRHPYASGQNAADAFAEAGLQDAPLVGAAFRSPAPGCLLAWDIDDLQPLMAARRSGAWNPKAQREQPFWMHYADPAYFAPQPVASAVAQLAANPPGSPVAIALVGNIPDGCSLPWAPLPALPAAIVDYGESYRLFTANFP